MLNKKNIIIYLSGCITVGIAWAVFTFWPIHTENKPYTKQLWGSKITNSDYSFKGKNITFKTESDGRGAVLTVIPKSNIIEYKHWISKNNIIQANIIFNINQITKPGFELCYYRRFGSFAAGGGFGYNAGIFFKFGGMYMF